MRNVQNPDTFDLGKRLSTQFSHSAREAGPFNRTEIMEVDTEYKPFRGLTVVEYWKGSCS